MTVSCIKWEAIKEYVETGALERLVRSPEVSAQYEEFKKKLNANGTNVVEQILEKRLRWKEEELKMINEKWYTTDQEKISHILRDENTLCVLENNFPYNFESDVSHILVWSKIYIPLFKKGDCEVGVSINEEVKGLVDVFLERLLIPLNMRDYVWFINYPHLQSVKTVSHIHVLIRTEDKETVRRLVREKGMLVTL